MSERGVFAVDRGVFDHPKFSHNGPLSRLEAWLWLLSRAAWRPMRFRISGRVIEVQRGQLAASTRFMADSWRWKEPRVRRFLHLLKTDPDNDAEIDTQTDAGVTVITIRKYDRYQRVSLPADALGDAGGNRGATHDQRKEESIKNIIGSEAKASGDANDPAIPEREYFLRGRQVLGRSNGGLIAKLLKAKGGNVPLARAAIEQASQKQNPIEYVAAICRGPPAARPATAHQQERQMGREILDDIGEFISSHSSKTDFGLLRHDTSDGSEGVCGRPGGNLIELSPSSRRKSC